MQTRLTSQQGISFTEFTYQLMQAYDYLHLHTRAGCTIQVGGSDQWGNIVAGIDLISRLTQGGTQDALVSSMNNLAVGPARAPEPTRRSIPPPPARSNVQQARALWAYNEDGRVSIPGLHLNAYIPPHPLVSHYIRLLKPY